MAKKAGPIKVGVLGLGRAGWDIHVRGIRDDKRYRITAVSDGMDARLEQAREELGCETFKSSDDLIKKADAELIITATPSHTHAPLAIKALKSGRDVVVEKPIASSSAEAKRVVDAAKKARRKLFCHHNYRFNPITRHLREIVESKIIGDLIQAKFTTNGYSRRMDWQTLKKYNGGLVNNHGTHYIDALLYIVGSPVNDIWSDIKLVSDAGDAEDHMKLLLKTKSGCVIDFDISTSSALPHSEWKLVGTTGAVSSNGQESTMRYYNAKNVKKQKVDIKPPSGRQYGNADKLPWKEKKVPSVGKAKGKFYDNVHEVIRKKGKMHVTPESVLEVLRVIESVRKGKIQNVRPKFK